MNSDNRILVTGAGGYVGGWIVESLYLTGFRNVRAGLRRWSSAARIGRFPVDIVLCDVLKASEIDRAMEGMNMVVHCAYGSVETTVQGTRNVLEAALKHRVQRFIHLSTVSVYGEAQGTVDEEKPYQVTGGDYGDSKIEAEKICWEFFKKGLPVVVLRPSAIYGPYDKLWISKFAERLMSGQWGIFETMGDGQCNIVYIQDLVDAVVLALDSERAVGEAFNINGSDSITWNDYFTAFNEELGLPPLQRIGLSRSRALSAAFAPVKTTARYFLSHYGGLITRLYQRYELVQLIMKSAEQRMKTTPGREELEMFGRRVRYSIGKAESILGFHPQVDVKQGLSMSVKWLTHEALLKVRDGKNNH